MAEPFKPPPLSAHEGPAEGFIPPPPVEDQPTKPTGVAGVIGKVRQFSQEHPYISGAASMLVPGAGALLDPTMETGKGEIKQLGRDAYGVITSPALGPIGMGAGYLGRKTGLTQKVQNATEPTNEMQKMGGYGVQAAEAAMPMNRIVGTLPDAARAGRNFQTVMSAAKDVPLDLTAASRPALRAQELGEAGNTVPKVMNKFLQRTTTPGLDPLTYERGRDFASTAGRLSAEENLRTTPQMKAQISALAKALNDANAAAAEQAGVGDLYQSAMKEYRNAMRIQGLKDTTGKLARNTAARWVAGAGLGAGGYAAYKALGDH